MTNPNISLTQEDIARVKELLKHGIAVETETRLLREGLSESVKDVADQLEIKPAQLNRAIKIAYKDSLNEEKEKLDEIEFLLQTLNKKQ